MNACRAMQTQVAMIQKQLIVTFSLQEAKMLEISLSPRTAAAITNDLTFDKQ